MPTQEEISAAFLAKEQDRNKKADELKALVDGDLTSIPDIREALFKLLEVMGIK